MKVLILITTYMVLLSVIVTSQNTSEQICTGIYDTTTETYALDVCTQNTMLGFGIHQKYYCQNDQVYYGSWYDNEHCSDDPNRRVRIESDIVCDGITSCPYALVRVFQSTLNCDSAYWTDRAFIVNVCTSSSDSTVGSEILECGQINGIVRKTYTGDSCDGDIIDTTTVIPGNDTCIINTDGFATQVMSCNTRSNGTSPIPFPTEPPTAPTPKPTAGGSASPSMAPTTPTRAPTIQDTDDGWFITAIVFICLFGVMLCGMVWLGYMVFNDRPRATGYDRAPQTEEAGVETTTR